MDAGLLSRTSKDGETSVLWFLSDLDFIALRESLLSFWVFAAGVIGRSFDISAVAEREPRERRLPWRIHLEQPSRSMQFLYLAGFGTDLKEGGPSVAATQFTWARTHSEQGRKESH